VSRAALALLVAGGLARAPDAGVKVKRSREVAAQFQREHPCPSTGKRWGACPGWVKDHIDPALQRRPGYRPHRHCPIHRDSLAVTNQAMTMADRTRGGRGVRSREGCAPAVLMRTPMAILDSVRHDVVYLWKQWSQKIKEPADADMLVFFGTLRRASARICFPRVQG
jgi:hypothetical protein